MSDAGKGIIWRVDTTSGAYSEAIKDPIFNPTAFPVGIDGIHILNGTLYFTNLATSLFGRIAITADGTAAGPIQTLTTATTYADDFAIAGDATSFVGGDNTLWRVKPDGTVDVVVGGANETAIQGITSAQFGRTRNDRNVLYVATQGGMLFLPEGSQIHGGQLLAINVAAFE